MSNLLLDTNILIHLVRGNKVADEVNEWASASEDPRLFISVVSLAEAESQVVQWKWPDAKVEKLSALLGSFICINIEQHNKLLVDHYVAIDTFSQGKQPAPGGQLLGTSSRNMGKNDLWIAATAYTLGATLITLDGDFDHLHEVFFRVQKFKR